MSFFDLQKYRRDEYALQKLKDDKERLERELEDIRWRERSDAYEREQQHHREFQEREQAKEEERNARWYFCETIENLRGEVEDLKLRRKFGIEEADE